MYEMATFHPSDEKEVSLDLPCASLRADLRGGTNDEGRESHRSGMFCFNQRNIDRLWLL